MKKRFSHTETMRSRDPDKVIKEKFSCSFMSNSKWYKLIETLTDKFDQIYLNHQLIYNDEINGHLFDSTDFAPFFLEPILFKEIEWIEIPSSFENLVNENNRKAGSKLYSQNIDEIKTEIGKVGEFESDITIQAIKIYGYKK